MKLLKIPSLSAGKPFPRPCLALIAFEDRTLLLITHALYHDNFPYSGRLLVCEAAALLDMEAKYGYLSMQSIVRGYRFLCDCYHEINLFRTRLEATNVCKKGTGNKKKELYVDNRVRLRPLTSQIRIFSSSRP